MKYPTKAPRLSSWLEENIPELSAILDRRLFTSPTVRRDHLNATLMHKLLIKTVTVKGFITNKLFRRISGKTTVDRCLNKLYFSQIEFLDKKLRYPITGSYTDMLPCTLQCDDYFLCIQF